MPCTHLLRPRAGWQISLPPGTVQCPGVDRLLVLIDGGFPDTQPRIVAPSLVEDGSWPHVEGKGMLCLKATRRGHDAGERVLRHLAWAVNLLNYDADARRGEFQREFGAYWGRSCDARRASTLYSLVSPQGPSREILYCLDSKRNELIFADGRQALVEWLRNTQRNPGKKDIQRTWLAWLDESPTPQSFPKTGADILSVVPSDFMAEVVSPGARLPLLIGASTETGPVLASLILDGAPEKEVLRGFRPSRLPKERIVESMAHRPVRRLPVQRVDGGYVHGRDHDPDYGILADKTVAIVGCGALGGFVARLLAQAGVGNFLFIDPDLLGTQNTARHVLGHRFVGNFKSDAMVQMLREDFPHLHTATAYRDRVDQLPVDRLAKLAACSLIVSSGIDFAGDAFLSRWRLAQEGAPAHVCAWMEPFALAGHAIAVLGNDDLLDAFDVDGDPVRELTQWNGTEIVISEAGCGNVFQPHGAVDLQRTVVLAARLALDVLQDKLPSSIWRTWQGDRDAVLRLGGTPAAAFDVSNIERHHAWPSESLGSGGE